MAIQKYQEVCFNVRDELVLKNDGAIVDFADDTATGSFKSKE